MRFYFIIIQLLLITLKSSAQFGNPEVIDSSFSIAVECISSSDLDNDGDQDIVVALKSDTVYWYENSNSTFNRMSPVGTNAFFPIHIDIADENTDGFRDILITNNGGVGSSAPVSVILYISNASMSFTELVLDDSIEATAVNSYFADVDNDTDLDVISCHDLEIATYENFGNDSFGARVEVANGVEFYNMVVSDFTGDGFIDFAVNSSSGVRVYENNQNGTFAIFNTITSDLFGFMDQSDIDNDGDADIIVPSNPSTDLNIDTNDGSGVFQIYQTSYFGVANQTSCIFELNDMNGDFFDDAVFCPSSGTGIYWKVNDTSGNLISTAFIDSAFHYSRIYTADIDGDTDNDIVWSDLYPFNSRHLGVIRNQLISSVNTVVDESGISFYPNPFGNALYLKSNSELKEIRIYDSGGKMVYESKVSPLYFNTSEWSTGKYYVKVNGYSFEILKQ